MTSGLRINTDGSFELIKLPTYLDCEKWMYSHLFNDDIYVESEDLCNLFFEEVSQEVFEEKGRGDKCLWQLSDGCNNNPGGCDPDEYPPINKAIDTITGVPVRGNVLIFSTYTDKEGDATFDLGLSLDECQRDISFILSCLKVKTSTHGAQNIPFTELEGRFREEVLKDDEKIKRLQRLALKMNIRDKFLF